MKRRAKLMDHVKMVMLGFIVSAIFLSASFLLDFFGMEESILHKFSLWGIVGGLLMVTYSLFGVGANLSRPEPKEDFGEDGVREEEQL